MSLSEEKVFDILGDYFKDNNYADIQLESFNNFITFGIKRIVENQSKMVIKVDEDKEVQKKKN